MSYNKVVKGQDLLDVMQSAFSTMDVVCGTMGPSGTPVILGKSFGAPVVTKDGHNVMNTLNPVDPSEREIVKLIGQATSRANEEAGDGTTTATVLSLSICDVARKQIASGRSRVDLVEGINMAAEKAVDTIAKLSRKVASDEEIAQVGAISANGNKDIGSKIAEAMAMVKKNGFISVEEGKGLEPFSVEVVKGMVCDRGYISPYFANANEKMSVSLENAYVFLANKKISNLQPLFELLNKVASSQKPLLIIAEDVEGEALTSLVLNKLKGTLKVVAIKAPGFGDRRTAILEDIQILTGANKIVSDDLAVDFEDIDISDLGYVRKITVSKDKTIIIADESDDTEQGKLRKSQIEQRVSEISVQAEDPNTGSYDKDKLRERMANLSDGIAVLKVGGATEVEVKERKDRVDDALNATKAAVLEGIVPGGGVTFLYAAKELDKFISDLRTKGLREDVVAGVEILKNALFSPAKRILQNAGKAADIIINELLNSDSHSYIYDSLNSKFVDAYEAGIIDPAKVLRVALQSAVSVVSILINTKSLVVDEKSSDGDDASSAAAGMGGMGGMGGMY
ncbi:molecular chaperone GroEL [Anaplasmataceae bacterium AB001_6]|nr:molecular chaperone GroEL [Anaplasmataceae bacterium AB001_6]